MDLAKLIPCPEVNQSRQEKTAQTPEQKARTVNLLLASDSPSAFVRSCLVKKKDGELGVVDLYEHYQEWCRENHLRSFPSKPFSRIAKEEIEITGGLKLRHDLLGENGKTRRGWKGLAFVGRIDTGTGEMGPESPCVELDGL